MIDSWGNMVADNGILIDVKSIFRKSHFLRTNINHKRI